MQRMVERESLSWYNFLKRRRRIPRHIRQDIKTYAKSARSVYVVRGAKIIEESKHKENIEDLDIGFRVLKVDFSNMKDVYYRPSETSQYDLDDLVENIKEDRSEYDLLFQLMLELGVELSSDIKEEIIDGKKIFSVMDDYLVATFDKDISEEVVEVMAKKGPKYAVICDDCLKDDSIASNFDQIFASYSPSTTRRII